MNVILPCGQRLTVDCHLTLCPKVRERMREAQSGVAELALEVAGFRQQGEQLAAAAAELQELRAALRGAEVRAPRG